jgi:type IV pilus assembly protein PilC
VATFTYSVRDARGAVSNGAVTAESRIDALNSLRGRGMFVIDLLEQEAETSVRAAGFGGGFFQRVKLEELSVFTRQFAAMIGAGIPVTRCLDTMARQQRNQYFSRLILQIKNDVASGLPLSGAMAKYPRVFNAMMISLLVAAEETGTMDTTMEQLALAFESEVALRQQISAGMRYPMIVAVAAMLVVTFVMIFVVPQFAEIFKGLGAKLPFMTQVLMTVALLMKRFWFLFVGAYFAIPWLLSLVSTLPGGRELLDQIKLKLPVFGELNRKIILSRI